MTKDILDESYKEIRNTVQRRDGTLWTERLDTLSRYANDAINSEDKNKINYILGQLEFAKRSYLKRYMESDFDLLTSYGQEVVRKLEELEGKLKRNIESDQELYSQVVDIASNKKYKWGERAKRINSILEKTDNPELKSFAYGYFEGIKETNIHFNKYLERKDNNPVKRMTENITESIYKEVVSEKQEDRKEVEYSNHVTNDRFLETLRSYAENTESYHKINKLPGLTNNNEDLKLVYLCMLAKYDPKSLNKEVLKVLKKNPSTKNIMSSFLGKTFQDIYKVTVDSYSDDPYKNEIREIIEKGTLNGKPVLKKEKNKEKYGLNGVLRPATAFFGSVLLSTFLLAGNPGTNVQQKTPDVKTTQQTQALKTSIKETEKKTDKKDEKKKTTLKEASKNWIWDQERNLLYPGKKLREYDSYDGEKGSFFCVNNKGEKIVEGNLERTKLPENFKENLFYCVARDNADGNSQVLASFKGPNADKPIPNLHPSVVEETKQTVKQEKKSRLKGLIKKGIEKIRKKKKQKEIEEIARKKAELARIREEKARQKPKVYGDINFGEIRQQNHNMYGGFLGRMQDNDVERNGDCKIGIVESNGVYALRTARNSNSEENCPSIFDEKEEDFYSRGIGLKKTEGGYSLSTAKS